MRPLRDGVAQIQAVGRLITAVRGAVASGVSGGSALSCAVGSQPG